MSTKKLTQDQFINRCQSVHGNLFDYSQIVYKNMATKVKVKCNQCDNNWMVSPVNFTNGSGCPVCKVRNQIGRDVKSTEQIINEIKKAHGDNLLYDRLVYKNCNTKVTVGCKIHGYFDKWPNDLKRGIGCSKCSGMHRKTHNEFLSILAKKLPHVVALDTFVNERTKLRFLCKKHNKQFKTDSLHIQQGSKGCSECVHESIINTRVQKGLIADPESKTEFERYKRAVWRFSNQAYKQHLSEQKRDRHNHLDHIVSIVDGFNSNVDPKILGSIHNLRVIPARENRRKSNKSDMKIEDLINKYLYED